MKEAKRKAKVVVVGGSIAGISCAHALLAAGWDVVVLEKTCSPPTGCATGAGLGLDPLSQKLIESWSKKSELLQLASLPLAIDHVKANMLETGDTIEIIGDLLVAADGCLSSIRKTFLPDLELRYSGYCAWRGVLEFSGNEDSETVLALRKAYPDLGKCNYFHLELGGHAILYELSNKRINWIWYLNQPEPAFKGNSVTMKVSSDMTENMYAAADKVWIPELVKVMRETKEPFLNAIYDSEPLEQIFWDNVVLIGDAAHPISPHGARSTNMSILDAAVLGKCLEKWGVENLNSALEEYQSIRMPVAKEQVMFSRRMGRIKQRLALTDQEFFDPMTASEEECRALLLRNIPYFSDIPSILM